MAARGEAAQVSVPVGEHPIASLVLPPAELQPEVLLGVEAPPAPKGKGKGKGKGSPTRKRLGT